VRTEDLNKRKPEVYDYCCNTHLRGTTWDQMQVEEEKKQKAKVFCSECRYFYSKPYTMCDHPSNIKQIDNWQNRGMEARKNPPIQINFMNDCKMYRPTLWFYIKRELGFIK